MSTKDLSSLEAQEIDAVKQLLRGLVSTLQAKKAAAGGKLITDEETVLAALTHPERGDVVVSIVGSGAAREVFVSNKRDATTPFALMDTAELRRHPDRRTVDGSRPEAREGRIALFLSSLHDQETFRQAALTRIDVYSSHFRLYEAAPAAVASTEPDLKNKPLAQCTIPEKWTIYKRDWDFDNRRDAIERELFSFEVTFGAHKAPARKEMVLLPPGKFGPNIGQMVRDIYPIGVRNSLRRDFPEDHKAKVGEANRALDGLREQILGRVAETNGAEYDAFLQELADVIADIQKADPELMRL